MKTLIEYVPEHTITPAMRDISRQEGCTPETVGERVAAGRR
jgi:thiamine biosynthesis protein ThiC